MKQPKDYIELTGEGKSKRNKPDFIHSDLYITSSDLTNPYVGLDRRPKNVDPQDNEWKNRHRISVKLSRANFVDGYKFLCRNGWNWSTGINYLLATHPEIQQTQKDLRNDA